MKVSVKFSKRLRFYTLFIACGAFLLLTLRNGWIDVATLTRYGILTFVCILIIVFFAAICAALIRVIANWRS